jgi:hypothetical protein
MQRSRRIFMFLILIGVLAAANIGCSVGSGAWLRPQSHFDFPNSNVIPLGKAQGQASTSSIFIPTIFDADVQEAAIQDALRKKGGDILIDYVMSYEVTAIPLIFLTVYETKIKVDGTACKMEIGAKPLK